MADQPTDQQLIGKARELATLQEWGFAELATLTGVTTDLAARLEAVIADLEHRQRLWTELSLAITHRSTKAIRDRYKGNTPEWINGETDALTALFNEMEAVIAERDAERARAEAAEARVSELERALDFEIVTQGKLERSQWFEEPDESVGRPGVTWEQRAEAVEEDAADDRHWRKHWAARAEAAEARVAELEADRKRLALTVAYLRHAIPASAWGDKQCSTCGDEAFLSSDGRYGDGDPALCGCGGCISVDEEARQVYHSDVQEGHSEDFAEIQEWAMEEVQEDAYKVRLPEPGGWQPIETAPKDGTGILVLNEEGVFEASVDDGRWTPLCSYYHGCGCCGGDFEKPSHWMPLPPPPAKQAATSGPDGGSVR